MGGADFRGLTSDALEAALLGLRVQERRLEVQVLHGLIEVERRRLYLDQGFGSLFAYCVGRLGYCESAAGRRIAAARALKRCPRIEGMLLGGELHLSTVAIAAREIEKDEAVLELIRGRTQRQVELILASRGRPAQERDSIRAVPGEDGVDWEFRFAASPGFREKFERARSLLSGKHPGGVSLEQVFEAALDEYLERRDPVRPRRARHSPRGSGRRSRAVPRALRRAVWSRDRGRCTFVGPDGRACGSTWDVEIDHVRPYCRGGDHRLENLRLLCSAHNRRRAERDLGTARRAPFQRRE